MSQDALGRERKTHCKNGHPYDDANTYWHTNWKGYRCRGCRTCVRNSMRKLRLDPAVQEAGRRRTQRWRENNPERYLQIWKRVEEEKKQVLLTARLGGCIKCGEKDPSCLDFHHRDPSTKSGHIGLFRKFGMKRLYAEIAKCDVLCANCHRKHHRDERQRKVSEGV